jgi:hypothetical protein
MKLYPVDPGTRLSHRPAGSSYYDYVTDVLWIKHGANWLLNHEFHHFEMHVSTPYGFLLQALVELQQQLVIDYFQQTHNDIPGQKIPLPLYSSLRSHRDKPTEANIVPTWYMTYAHDYVVPWSRMIFLENLLEGRDCTSVQSSTAADGVAAMSQFEYLWGHREAFQRNRRNHDGTPAIYDPPPNIQITESHYKLGSACPVVKIGKKKISIGALHLMEGLAQHIQEGRPGTVAPQAIPPEDALSNTQSQVYWVLWFVFLQELGLERFRREPSGYHLAFLALAEMALFTPAGPVYGRLRHNGMDWSDVHPGYRFIKSLKVLREVSPLQNMQRDLLTFQSEIAERLRWPSPTKFVSLIKHFDVDVSIHFIKRHIAACEKRKETTRPTPDFTLCEQLQTQFLDQYAPIYWDTNHQEFTIAHENAHELMERFLRYFMPGWCWEAMMIGPPRVDSLLLVDARFSRYFDMESDKQLAQWVIECNPWMATSRFARFP